VANDDGEDALTNTMQLEEPGVCGCSSTFDNVRNQQIGLLVQRFAKNPARGVTHLHGRECAQVIAEALAAGKAARPASG
jgi:hypothetical protein